MKKAFLVVLLALVLVCLCIVQAEEFNGTTYNLSLSDMEVAQYINGTSFNITTNEKTDNISLLTPEGRQYLPDRLRKAGLRRPGLHGATPGSAVHPPSP
jgi:hypothetical protein